MYGSFKPLKKITNTAKAVAKETYTEEDGTKVTIVSINMNGKIESSK